MSVVTVLDNLKRDPGFMANVAAWERMPAQAARMADFPPNLDHALVEMLRSSGIEFLYTHQAQAITAALNGENVTVVTPTASGKTLCYNLPVLQACRADPLARALYLFPTKALAQDQAAALGKLIEHLDKRIPVNLYDGDTPSAQRSAIRQQSGILISNPDMLHRGILPYHTRWAAFFENLRYVVIDELHAYRGVFGSHVANVLRRLRRICRFYGTSPIFLCASATVANPRELAEKLVEAPVHLIDEDGAPHSERHFLIYNPPTIDPMLGIRRSYTLESKQIAGRFLAGGVQTLVFARARLTAEVLLGYLRDEVAYQDGDPVSVHGYRGGYLPHERRAIEHGLRGGTIRGVVATNALELGVDIGQLGAVIIAGYPGTLASARQQAGRAGRRDEPAAAVLVASGAPLDQYIAQHPRYLFDRGVENARINADNLIILLNHVRCAAFELPFTPGERFGTFGDVTDLLDFLAEDEQSLRKSPDSYRWIAPGAPAENVSLRTGTGDTIVIQDMTTPDDPLVIGQIDRQTAPLMVYQGAIYLHEGRQYEIEALDWGKGIAAVRQTSVDFYTEASASSEVQVIDEDESEVVGDVLKARGLVEVTWRATSYRLIRRYTHETLGQGLINLPEQRFETTAYWLYLTPDLMAQMNAEGVILQPNDYGPNWQTQRNAARARDGYRCRNCNAAESSMQHHVHHITPFRTFGYVPGQNTNYKIANQLENLITLCPSCHRAAETAQRTRSALSGLGTVLRSLATLYLMCEPGDLGLVVEQQSTYTGAPTITLYDNLPAGLGFSDKLYELHNELLKAAHELIRDCPCPEGCPACIGPANEVGSEAKTLTLRLIQSMIARDAQ